MQNRVTRRTFLEAGAAGAVFAAAGPALAQTMQQPPRAKGPRVWLDLDQKELDDAYDQSVYAPNQAQITGRYATNSEITRARLGDPLRFAYGSAPVEGLEFLAGHFGEHPTRGRGRLPGRSRQRRATHSARLAARFGARPAQRVSRRDGHLGGLSGANEL